MEKFSPDWLTEKIILRRLKVEGFIDAKLQRESFFQATIWLLILSLAIAFWYNQKTLYFWKSINEKLVVYYSFLAILCFIPIVFSNFLKSLRVGFVFKILSIFLVFSYSFLSADMKAALVSVGYFLVSRLALRFVFHIFQNKDFVKKTIVTSFVCIFLINVCYAIIYFDSDFHILGAFSYSRLIFLLYLPLLEYYEAKSRAENIGLFSLQLWHPANVLYPIPTRFSYWKKDKSVARISGLVDVILGFFFIYVLQILKNSGSSAFGSLDFSSFLQSGLWSYLTVYLLSVSSICIPVGLIKVSGYSMPAPYLLPLLAASPADRWRRWNTYFFNFYNWAVFFPIYKKSKSLFLAVFVTFFFTSLMHTTKENFFVLVDNSKNYLSSEVLFFFVLHGLAVYFSLVFNFKFFNGQRLLGWLGVLITWGIMIVIHSYRY